jgi:hypothetical protein
MIAISVISSVIFLPYLCGKFIIREDWAIIQNAFTEWFEGIILLLGVCAVVCIIFFIVKGLMRLIWWIRTGE